MGCETLNLPDLSESDPGKPIKASWGDRVVEAIQQNCETIVGFGPANSVFNRFHGDGSAGNLDATFSQTVAVPAAGIQYENLTVRAGVVLFFNSDGGAQGHARIGVSGTLTMEAGAVIHVNGRGFGGGGGGAGGTQITGAGWGGWGGGSGRQGWGQLAFAYA